MAPYPPAVMVDIRPFPHRMYNIILLEISTNIPIEGNTVMGLDKAREQTEKSKNIAPNNKIDATWKYFLSIIQKIYDELIPPAEGLALGQKSNNKVQVTCLPCSGTKSKHIDAGCKTKSLSNLKAHLKTPSHKTKAANFSTSAPKRQPHADETCSVKAQAGKASSEDNFQIVVEKFPRSFELLRL